MAWFFNRDKRAKADSKSQRQLSPQMVARGAAERILNSPSDPGFTDALMHFGHTVDSRCKQEWIVINMFATYKGIAASDIPEPFKVTLLRDSIPDAIDELAARPEDERASFREFVQARFSEYDSALAETQPFALPAALAWHLVASEDIAIAYFARLTFHNLMMIELDLANRLAVLIKHSGQ